MSLSAWIAACGRKLEAALRHWAYFGPPSLPKWPGQKFEKASKKRPQSSSAHIGNAFRFSRACLRAQPRQSRALGLLLALLAAHGSGLCWHLVRVGVVRGGSEERWLPVKLRVAHPRLERVLLRSPKAEVEFLGLPPRAGTPLADLPKEVRYRRVVAAFESKSHAFDIGVGDVFLRSCVFSMQRR